MEVKVFQRHIKSFGLDEYKSLHEDILSSNGDLLMIKKLYDKIYQGYDLINTSHKNIYFQGYTIEKGYVYFITNLKTGRKYVGQTRNLISRIEAYIRLDIDNTELKTDIINLGLKNFSIDFLECDDHIEQEKVWIKHYQDNCYNKIYAGKKFYSKNKSYTINDRYFASKKTIKEYVRQVLDNYVPGYILDEKNDKEEIDFAKEMIKLHPKYKSYGSFLDTGKDISLMIIKDNLGNAYGVGKWNIFHFEWTDEKNKKQPYIHIINIKNFLNRIIC
jgi:hypothetical protein